MKTSKSINAGDTLTVGGLTDDYLGAVIEVGTLVDITYTFTLGSLGDDWYSQKSLWTPKVRVGGFYPNTQVTVIAPPTEENNMSKKISAGDTLTAGDLADDHLGAFIEVGPTSGVTYGFEITSIERRESGMVAMWTAEKGVHCAYPDAPVKIITPPPVVQPDEPTILGQCIRIEGDDGWLGIVADTQGGGCRIWDTAGYWFHWDSVLRRAGDHQIIVSDPPRWPDETPAVPERIERGEWPADDTHLRDYKWIDRDGGLWRWDDRDNRKSGWNWNPYLLPLISPLFGPWTRGERVK